MRPATFARVGCASSHSGVRSPYASNRSLAVASRRKSLGNGLPISRRRASFVRRSAIRWLSLSSSVIARLLPRHHSQPALQARFEKPIEIAVEHGTGVAHLDIGAQVLDP